MNGKPERAIRRDPPTVSFLAAVAAGALIAVSACGSQSETRPATWGYISTAIVQPSCATASCHSNLANRSGVELERIASGYKVLLDRAFVVPGAPESSALMPLIRGQGSRRMPPDFPLPDDDIELIARWIAEGAKP